MKRTQRRKGLHRPPPASTLSSSLYERILQFKALSWMFAQKFSDAAKDLGFNYAALKDLFNSALDEPLNWWRMRGLDHLSFGEFVEFLARSPAKEAGVPQVAADEAAVLPVVVDGAAAPPVAADEAAASRSRKRRRRRRRKASSTLQGLEAVSEPSAGQEAFPEPPKRLALPVPPKRPRPAGATQAPRPTGTTQAPRSAGTTQASCPAGATLAACQAAGSALASIRFIR